MGVKNGFIKALQDRTVTFGGLLYRTFIYTGRSELTSVCGQAACISPCPHEFVHRCLVGKLDIDLCLMPHPFVAAPYTRITHNVLCSFVLFEGV